MEIIGVTVSPPADGRISHHSEFRPSPANSLRILTVHADLDALGDAGRHPVRGDAQIGAHVHARYLANVQRLALPLDNCCEPRPTHPNSRALIWNANEKSLPQCVPLKSLLMEIFELSSRFHLTDGDGLPVARHFSVTLEPSCTTTSVDVSESSMLGGTGIFCVCVGWMEMHGYNVDLNSMNGWAGGFVSEMTVTKYDQTARLTRSRAHGFACVLCHPHKSKVLRV